MTKIIKVGSSKGIIIPAHILKELSLNLGDTLHISLSVDKNSIILSKPNDFLDQCESFLANQSNSSDWNWD